jgi:hypothetical protein
VRKKREENCEEKREEKCEEKHNEKEAKEVAQRAAKVDECEEKIIEATLILENCKNYKEVNGMFPGQKD